MLYEPVTVTEAVVTLLLIVGLYLSWLVEKLYIWNKARKERRDGLYKRDS